MDADDKITVHPPQVQVQGQSSSVDNNNNNNTIIEMLDDNNNNNNHANDQTLLEKVESDDTKQEVTQSFPPSHILEDGRLVFLPPPNAMERSRFFERSIARHGLLQADMNKNSSSKTKEQNVKKILEEDNKEQKDDKEDDKNDNKTTLKIHPLAVASARLQSNGLNELNRAINLATLVNTGEFFSYTNVVDPSFEADATSSNTNNSNSNKSSTTSGAAAAAAGSSSAYYSVEATAQRTEALFSLKRKRTQFEKASQVLNRHERRLWAGIQAQHVIDRRLFQLRQQWRLVAPEHGTRARLHAARTNEIIAVDVDVYDRDRVHGGNQALMGSNKSKVSLAGRLASRVPRFATIELQDTFKVKYRGKNATVKNKDSDEAATESNVSKKESPSDDKEMKDVEKNEKQDSDKNNLHDDVDMKDSTSEETNNTPVKESKEIEEDNFATKFTRAEPFAIADPTLGRVIENFDPSKIPMLNMQLDIQKSSTGFLQSACLEPMTTLSSSASDKSSSAADAGDDKTKNDEELLISLQHSLFCANLFESMRSELDPDNISNNEKRGNQTNNAFSPVRQKTLQSMAWLASESEENYVAPPSFLVGSNAGRGLAALSVVHCHEGEVKVQLDSEYQLCLKLVEANAEETIASPSQLRRESQVGISKDSKNSGSQSPAQLHAFCRALLLYAQDVYHRHSLYLHEREKKKREDEAVKGDEPRGLARIKKEDAPEQARILQSCVSLGSKMLFEKRIRKSLSRVSKWLMDKYGEKLSVEWLSLSIFDLHSKFTVCCRQLIVDGLISRDNLTITRISDSEDFRKANFHTEKEFEIYLKLELRRQM